MQFLVCRQFAQHSVPVFFGLSSCTLALLSSSAYPLALLFRSKTLSAQFSYPECFVNSNTVSSKTFLKYSLRYTSTLYHQNTVSLETFPIILAQIYKYALSTVALCLQRLYTRSDIRVCSVTRTLFLQRLFLDWHQLRYTSGALVLPTTKLLFHSKGRFQLAPNSWGCCSINTCSNYLSYSYSRSICPDSRSFWPGLASSQFAIYLFLAYS